MLAAILGLLGLTMAVGGAGGGSTRTPSATNARPIQQPPVEDTPDDIPEPEEASEDDTPGDTPAPEEAPVEDTPDDIPEPEEASEDDEAGDTPAPEEASEDDTSGDTPAPEEAPVEDTPDDTPEPEEASEDDTPAPEDTPAEPPTPSTATGDDPQTIDNQGFSAGDTVDIDGGRVTTLELETTQNITALEVINGPAHGNATVNPDNTIAFVLSGSDYSGELSLDYKVTYEDGTTETSTLDLVASAPSQDAGWGEGAHYMLEEDENGDVIVETGENHRKVFVSESDDALTLEDIAALEGLEASDITTQWLVDHPEYGGDEEMALVTEVGMDVWREITVFTSVEPVSHWLLFEKGYEYEEDDLGRVISRASYGEDELHPIHVTSWGEGEKPVISGPVSMVNEHSENIVFTDLTFTGEISNVSADNTLFSDVSILEKGIYVLNVDGLTIHDSEVAYVGAGSTPPSGDTWVNPRVQGIFAENADSILIEGSLIHHNGWEDDYTMDGSTSGGLPPTTFSHNIYLQNDTTDVTIRDNIISQGASFGAHVRGGGFIEDNAFIDNNYAIDFLGGVYETDGPIGNFSLFADNLITSAGYKYTTTQAVGGVSGGVYDGGFDSTLIDNIVTHLADPNDPTDIVDKHYANSAVFNENEAAYDDTIVYNWRADINEEPDQNTEDLDTVLADQTTIQNYAASVLGEGATIQELMDHILALNAASSDDTITADDIIAYFQEGFGVEPNGDEAQTDHRFVPNNLADGFRWDNRLNWDSEDVPDDGDSVSLAGNWVHYGGTTTIADLDLGSGGRIEVHSGRLTVDGDLETGANGGTVITDGAGQFWINGYQDVTSLNVEVDGGRFANTGDVTGSVTVEATDGQLLLGVDDATFEIGDGSELRVTGSEARVGFDGTQDGISILDLDEGGTLSFLADEDGSPRSRNSVRVTLIRMAAWYSQVSRWTEHSTSTCLTTKVGPTYIN